MVNNESLFPFQIQNNYQKRVAYFSMEYALDQSLKIYSGGLGFLAGSHLRSAYDLKQNLFAIGILWKFGYYDQIRDIQGNMQVHFTPKEYSFLKDTGVKFKLEIHGSPVWVKAYLLEPEIFGSAPLFLLSTDIEENDLLSRTITHRLYDPIEATRIAQSMVLGIGGAMLIDILNLNPDVYHMNEGHSVPLNFYLYSKLKNLEEVRKKVVFTTHTPELAGNEEHSYSLLSEMSFFFHLQDHEVKSILDLEGERFNYTLAALKFSRIANGVSKLHGEVARQMWNSYPGICPIKSITNAQNKKYWADKEFDKALKDDHNEQLISRKMEMKLDLFKRIADQSGKMFRPEILTMVWARRFAGYKRADLLLSRWDDFMSLVQNQEFPIQIIWAGKPYPEDFGAIDIFNKLISKTRDLPNCTVLTGYELELSALLKKGSDIWLNNPRLYREASGTSGMTAAMNGSINLSIPDGWVPEFCRMDKNSFLIETAPDDLKPETKDEIEANNLILALKNHIIPLYYSNQNAWLEILKTAAREIVPEFDSDRMVHEYYELIY